MDGRLIDFELEREYPARAALERLILWTAPMRAELSIDPVFPELNGAQRQRRMIDAGASREDVYSAVVNETRESYRAQVNA
jgi:carboxylate-amine ligase